MRENETPHCETAASTPTVPDDVYGAVIDRDGQRVSLIAAPGADGQLDGTDAWITSTDGYDRVSWQ